MSDCFILVHSPLVGPSTWLPVAEQLSQKGFSVVVPTLTDSPNSTQPYWQQYAESIPFALQGVATDVPLIFVGHSGAGPLLPALRQACRSYAVAGYIFVDAGLPQDRASPLDLIRSEGGDWVEAFQQHLVTGGRFPDWTENDLRDIVPDAHTRQQLLAELRPRGLDFFEQPIPVFEGWPDARCAYLRFSTAYLSYTLEAQRRGWPVRVLEAGHFHILVEPVAVAQILLQLIAGS